MRASVCVCVGAGVRVSELWGGLGNGTHTEGHTYNTLRKHTSIAFPCDILYHKRGQTLPHTHTYTHTHTHNTQHTIHLQLTLLKHTPVAFPCNVLHHKRGRCEGCAQAAPNAVRFVHVNLRVCGCARVWVRGRYVQTSVYVRRHNTGTGDRGMCEQVCAHARACVA